MGMGPLLTVGAILPQSKRTEAAALQVIVSKGEKQYQDYRRALIRARWSDLQLGRILMDLPVSTLVALNMPAMVGADEISEFFDMARSKLSNQDLPPISAGR